MTCPTRSSIFGVTAAAIPPGRMVPRSIRDICAVTAEKHGLTYDEITGKQKAWRYSHPRQEVFYLARKLPKSLPQIAGFFGCDHTTVIKGIEAHMRRNNITEQ